jgi:hypothetical protein
MQIRIRIQLLVKVMLIGIQPSTASFGSFSQLHGPPWLLNYEFEVYLDPPLTLIRILLFTLMRIRLPTMLRIRIRNTDFEN